MKGLKNKLLFLLPLVLFLCFRLVAQDSVARELNVSLNFYMTGGKIPCLKFSAREKVERKFIPQQHISAAVYAGNMSDNNLLKKIITDHKGEGWLYFPPSFKPAWDSASRFTFTAVTESTKIFGPAKTELTIARALIQIDTSSEDGARNVIVTIKELKKGEWLPAKEVEVKIGIKRLLGNLPVGEEESYTTDSAGTVTAEFKRDSLPGNEKNEFTIIAHTEDNELYGNLFVEKTVKWGATPKRADSFNKRSLWAARHKSPAWLLVMAYSIILSVWGVLIYLVLQLVKIRKLGKRAEI